MGVRAVETRLRGSLNWGVASLLGCLGCLGLCASSVLALDAASPLVRGWAPWVAMYGHRDDPAGAVAPLRAANRTLGTILTRTELDPATDAFVTKAWKELEDFHLDDFHDLLPAKRGDFREIGVTGAIQGSTFHVRQADLAKPFEVTVKGNRRALGDFSARLAAKPTRVHGDHRAFLLRGHTGFAIGSISFRSLVDAGTLILRLVSGGASSAGSPPVQASAGALKRIKALHPQLGLEDLEVVSLLHDAFPAMSEALGEVVRIDDLRTAGDPAQFTKVTFKARILPARLKKRYPDLAKHLDKLDKLAHARFTWLDARGRRVAVAELDTNTMELGVECYVKDGMLLPWTKEGAITAEPIDLMGSALARTHLSVDARFKVLGLVLHFDHLRVDMRYANEGLSGHLTSSITTLPGIRVEGAALGFVPTGLIDAFIPGNIASLTRDFLDVAVRGNDGRGVVLSIDAGAMAPGQAGALEVALGLEALDNFMVKLGVGVFNERFVPDDDESADLERLRLRLHQAFSKDFERFASSVKAPG